jgi:Asp-tRNA(Asn)/Glu-tRNA(Gln) amidotransferase A subunit family amidase
MNSIGPNVSAVQRCAEVIERRESTVHAWACLDLSRAHAEAEMLDHDVAGSMSGITLGVKDMFDTAQCPTEYGSALFAGHRPRADAAVVAAVREAGAILLGKTVTAEFAGPHPGATTNPHDPTHTPGGSSMGSAAAVAAGMADIAFGTQTAASITRPASFCGVYGFKPTFGTVSTGGLKLVAPSLDTVGWFARDPVLLQLVHTRLTGRASAPATRMHFAVCRTPMWSSADTDTRAAVESLAAAVGSRGVPVRDDSRDLLIDGLANDQITIMNYEIAQSLVWEGQHRPDISEAMGQVLDAGHRIPASAYDLAQKHRRQAQSRLDSLFGEATVLITAAAMGEAPAGLDTTGDPVFGRIWSVLGLPTVSIPWTTGSSGLPVGVQLVARRGHDTDLLAITRWLASG